jgi:hypothetical protein
MNDSLRSQPETVQLPSGQTEASREGGQRLAGRDASSTQTLYLGVQFGGDLRGHYLL